MTNPYETMRRFEQLVTAAQTLAIAGLANDPIQVRVAARSSDFIFHVPYVEGIRSHWVAGGGYYHGALKALLNEICEKSGVFAYYQDVASRSWLVTQIKLVRVTAPDEVTAHEVVAANALLREALAAWGNPPDLIDTWLEPAP